MINAQWKTPPRPEWAAVPSLSIEFEAQWDRAWRFNHFLVKRTDDRDTPPVFSLHAMSDRFNFRGFVCRMIPLLCLFLAGPTQATAQSRLKSTPAYKHYEHMSKEIAQAIKSGAISVTW